MRGGSLGPGPRDSWEFPGIRGVCFCVVRSVRYVLVVCSSLGAVLVLRFDFAVCWFVLCPALCHLRLLFLICFSVFCVLVDCVPCVLRSARSVSCLCCVAVSYLLGAGRQILLVRLGASLFSSLGFQFVNLSFGWPAEHRYKES